MMMIVPQNHLSVMVAREFWMFTTSTLFYICNILVPLLLFLFSYFPSLYHFHYKCYFFNFRVRFVICVQDETEFVSFVLFEQHVKDIICCVK